MTLHPDFQAAFSLLTDNIVDYSQISKIRMVNEKITTKGKVCEIEVYKGGLKVGKDRVFEDDLIQLLALH